MEIRSCFFQQDKKPGHLVTLCTGVLTSIPDAPGLLAINRG